MKQHLFLLAFTFLGMIAEAQDPTISFTTTKTTSISLGIRTVAAATVSIDWGNGTPVDYTFAPMVKQTLSQVPSGTNIKIYGDNINIFEANSCGITNVNLSRAVNLTILALGTNSLTVLDLLSNTKLQNINVTGNQLVELDLSNKPSLNTINVSSNSFDACALNSIYSNLPDRTATTMGAIRNKSNVGDATSNTSIATSKNWGPVSANDILNWVAGDGTGCTTTVAFTTTKTEAITLGLRTSVRSSVRVDWGNQITKSYILEAGSLTNISETPTGSNIKVFGDNINIFQAPSCGIESVDLSNAVNLSILSLATNSLTDLDLSTNTKLQNINVSSNQLTTLDVSNKPSLNTLQIINNSFDACELNNIYIDLPDRTGTTMGSIRNSSNIGAETSNTSIAIAKNWGAVSATDQNYWVDGSGTGCPLTNTVDIPKKDVSTAVIVNNTLKIKSTETINRIILINIAGKIVLEGKNTSSIDVSSLSNDIYIVKLYTQSGVNALKVVKK